MTAAFLWSGCTPAKPTPPRPVKVLIVGLDGASWSFLDPLLARGKLPELKRLVDEGVRAPLKTLSPSLSVVVWTSMVTGKTPEQHGLTDWTVTVPETGEKILANSASRKTEALWTMLSRSGRSAGFVGWWATWPAEPVRGYMVSDQFARREVKNLAEATYPPELAEELEQAMSDDWPWLRLTLTEGKLKVLSDGAPNAASWKERWSVALHLYGQDYRVEQAAIRTLQSRPRPDLVGVLSRKIDGASHYMWRFLPEAQRDEESFSKVLEPVYAYEDALLGRLVALSGPAINVIVVSDHGFERWAKGYDHKYSSPDGIFIAWGPDIKKNLTLSDVSVYDVAPTILHLLDLPVARDMKGRVLQEAFENPHPVRWVSTYETGRPYRRAARSPIQDRILEQLRSLGYLQ